MPTKRHITKRRGTTGDRLLTLARRRGVLRPRDLKPHGLSRETLRRLIAAGELERRGRGLYVAAGAALSEHEMLAVASARVPHGVVCLLSALRFHELTTQNPSEVWLAIDRKARAERDRKSTRLNSSHQIISYAVFCLKKKKKKYKYKSN